VRPFGSTGYISICGDQYISVLPEWVYPESVEAITDQTQTGVDLESVTTLTGSNNVHDDADREKAQFIFGQVFGELNVKWVGPKFDFDRDAYKALIDSGNMKGRLVYISTDNLQDRDVSAESIKQKLLNELK
jgi:hypothetical protein